MKKIIRWTVSIVLGFSTAASWAQTAGYVKNARLSTAALILTNTASPDYYGPSINGTTDQQNALLNYGGYQFAVYYNSSRQLCVARRLLTSTTWNTITFSYATSDGEDSHRTANIGICPIDDSVHIAFDHHASPLRYIATGSGGALVSDANWAAGLFCSERNYLKSGEELTVVTYPRFVVANNNKLLLFWRRWGSSNGIELFNEYSGYGSWSSAISCTDNTGTFEGSTVRSTYVNPICYQGGRIYMSWAWREGTSTYTHDLHYAYSDDNGRNWYNAKNVLVATSGAGSYKMGINSDVKVRTIFENREMSNQFGQSIDSHGDPHIVLRHADAAYGTQKYFHYVKNVNNNFPDVEIDLPAGTRPKVYCDSYNTLWLVARIGQSLCIYASKESTGWQTWNVAYDGTGGYDFINDMSICADGSKLYVMCQRDGTGNTSSLFVYEFNLQQD